MSALNPEPPEGWPAHSGDQATALRTAHAEIDRLRAENTALREAFEEMVTIAQEGEEFTDPSNPDPFAILKTAEDLLSSTAANDYRARIRREALEEAARACMDLALRNSSSHREQDGMELCADRIRALMERL